jgi:hypothetical protein
LPLFVAGLIQAVGVWGPLATAGCDLSFAPETPAAGPPRSPPNGIVCGATVCEAGTVCCLQDGGPVCDRTGDEGWPVFGDAAVESGACYGPSLGCDGPEDCPGAYCCPLGLLFSTDYTACTVAPAGSLGPCPGFAEPLCHTDSDCPSWEHCVPDDGGANTYDPLAGHVSYCQ